MNYYNYYHPTDFKRSALPTNRWENTSMQSNGTVDIFKYPENFNHALSLIQQAVQGENEDRLFYTYLIENAPTEEEKQIISGIRDNEINHFNLFHTLYYEITGDMIPQQISEQFIPPLTYCEGLKRALLGEQNAVARYRQILYAMQTPIHINMLTEIITDEIRHGSLYNYLYSKNNCNA